MKAYSNFLRKSGYLLPSKALTNLLLAGLFAFLSVPSSGTAVTQFRDFSEFKKHLQGEPLVFVVGHGSKSQIADVDLSFKKVDQIVQEFDQKFGGRWNVVYGGDPFQENAPDVSHIMHYLHKKHGKRIFAVQIEDAIKYGVPTFVDKVFYVPSSKIPTLDAHGKVVMENGKAKLKSLWGGVLGGEPVSSTAYLLAYDSPVSHIVAFGGGPIATQEFLYACKRQMPAIYVRTLAKHQAVNGPFGQLEGLVHLCSKIRIIN